MVNRYLIALSFLLHFSLAALAQTTITYLASDKKFVVGLGVSSIAYKIRPAQI